MASETSSTNLSKPFQISHAELDFIVTKAEQWRGEEGERRKTAIYDYVWEEEVCVQLFNIPLMIKHVLHIL